MDEVEEMDQQLRAHFSFRVLEFDPNIHIKQPITTYNFCSRKSYTLY